MKMKLISALVAASMASGCATVEQHQAKRLENSGAVIKKADAARKTFASTQVSAAPLVVQDDSVWVTAKSVQREDANLPPVFFKNFFLTGGGKLNIAGVSERVQSRTGMPVRLNPDVFMTMNQLMANASGGSAAAVSAAPGAAVPTAPGVTPQPTSPAVAAATYATEIDQNFSGSLASFLDLVSTKMGINWEYRDNSIYMYRLVTKHLKLKGGAPGGTEYELQLGKTGSATSGSQSSGGSSTTSNNGSFSSTSTVRMQSGQTSVWSATEVAVKNMLSPVGKATINQSTGTISVTDVKHVVDRVEKYVDHENGILTRQIAFTVQVYSVSVNDNAEYGLDWNLVFSKLSNLVPDWKLSFASPTSLTGATAGSLGIQILSPITSDGSLTSQLSGSQAFFKALSEIGQTSVVTTQSAVTMNREPVSIALTTQTFYLASTTPSTATAGSGTGVPGLNPGVVTTGYMLNALPTVEDNNSILLQFGLDISDLKRIVQKSVGSGATQQSIESPELTTTQFIQRVTMKPGDTLVLSGFERGTDSYDKRGLTKDAPVGAGGSYSGKGGKEATVILVTPVLIEGA